MEACGINFFLPARGISVNLDVGHGKRAGLCPPSDTVVYIFEPHSISVVQHASSCVLVIDAESISLKILQMKNVLKQRRLRGPEGTVSNV